MEAKPTVFVVDDDEGVCESLRRLAETVGCLVVAYGGIGALLREVSSDCTGCLIVDVCLSKTDGLDVQKELAEREVNLPVIMTANHADIAMAVEAMKAGAFDFIEKPLGAMRVMDSIRRALAHDLRLRPFHAQRRYVRLRLAALSRRERQVLELVCTGMASSDIAMELRIRTKTVEVYRSHINKKMGARNAADLVRMLHCVVNPSCGAAAGGMDNGYERQPRWALEQQPVPMMHQHSY